MIKAPTTDVLFDVAVVGSDQRVLPPRFMEAPRVSPSFASTRVRSAARRAQVHASKTI